MKVVTVKAQTVTSVFKNSDGTDYVVPTGKKFKIGTVVLSYVSNNSDTPLQLELRDGVGGTLVIPWIGPVITLNGSYPFRGDSFQIDPAYGFQAGNKIEMAFAAGSGRVSVALFGLEENA